MKSPPPCRPEVFQSAPLPRPPVTRPVPSVPSSFVAELSRIVRFVPLLTERTLDRMPVNVNPARSSSTPPRFSAKTTLSVLSRSMTICVPEAVPFSIASAASCTVAYSVAPIRATGSKLYTKVNPPRVNAVPASHFSRISSSFPIGSARYSFVCSEYQRFSAFRSYIWSAAAISYRA